MKVFTDLHHGDLYFSLHRLFEVRLGWELYRPIGLEWFHEGYWKIAAPYNNALDTVNQYLYINHDGYHAYKNLNGQHYKEDDIYYAYDPGHRYYQKGITLEQFKETSFDILLPSIAAHETTYRTLRKKFQPQAKLIAHLGNAGQRTSYPNVIYSIPYTVPSGQNAVFMHQELDPDIYQLTEPNLSTKNIYSMVNCLPFAHLYHQYKSLLSECNWKAYGASCPDGPLDGSRGCGQKMVEANIGWQLKPLGGLGHTAMGWFMSGRPVVTNMSENRKSGGEALDLFQPGITCLDIEAHTPEENCNLIREMIENNNEWSKRVYKRFTEIINYDQEEQDCRKFLERVL